MQTAFDDAALAFVENDLPRAIAKLEDCLRSAPDMDSALYLLALAHLRAGETAAAQELLERVVRLTQNLMLRDMAMAKLALLARLAGRPPLAPQQADAPGSRPALSDPAAG